MKSKPLKYFALITAAMLFLIIALGFITADKKEDDKNVVFIKRIISKENI